MKKRDFDRLEKERVCRHLVRNFVCFGSRVIDVREFVWLISYMAYSCGFSLERGIRYVCFVWLKVALVSEFVCDAFIPACGGLLLPRAWGFPWRDRLVWRLERLVGVALRYWVQTFSCGLVEVRSLWPLGSRCPITTRVPNLWRKW